MACLKTTSPKIIQKLLNYSLDVILALFQTKNRWSPSVTSEFSLTPPNSAETVMRNVVAAIQDHGKL